MKGEKKLLRATVFVLVASCIFSVFAFCALAQGKESYTPHANTVNDTVYGDSILQDELSIIISEAEADYLREYGELQLVFPRYISTAYVDVSYDEPSATLTVSAREYKYESESGVLITWRPQSAGVGGREVLFAPDSYTLCIDSVEKAEENKVTVKYAASFTVPEATVNRLLNLAYNDVSRLIEEDAQKKEAAVAAREQYYKDILAYEDYVIALSEYEASLAVYKKYLSEKKVYDEKYLEYQDYLSDLAEYERQKLLYEEYLLAREKYYSDYALYLDYLVYAEKYQSKIEAYDEYVKKLDKIKNQLAVIDATKTPVTTLNRTVYFAIMGDTVTSVIANKDVIANEIVGASPEAIDRAGIATENLRLLLTDYFSLTTEAERYSYYNLNYEGFRDNFADLLRCLDKLYMNRKVRGILISQDKQEKYVILLAQLYCVANALSDTPVSNYDKTGYFDENYIVGKGYSDQRTPEQILGEIYITDLNAATPVYGGYPQAVEKPQYTLMSEPVMPTPVPLPAPPNVVEEPTAPAVIDEPTPPTPIKDPGPVAPSYETPSVIAAIIAQKDSLCERASYVGDLILNREISVSKTFIDRNDVTVVFYDREPNAYGMENELYRTTIEEGSYADYLGKLPEKLEDSEAIYTFSHWTDKDGNAVDITAISEDIYLYPAFSAQHKSYEVVWVVDGVTYTENPGIPTRADSGKYYYEFSHWNSVTDEAGTKVTYNAVFQKKYILELYGGTGADITVGTGGLSANIGSYNGMLDIRELVKRAAESGTLTVKSTLWEAHFSYGEVLKLYESGVFGMSVSAVLRSSGGYFYSYKLYDELGDELSCDVRAALTFPMKGGVSDALVIFSEEGGERSYVRYTVGDGSLTFAAQPMLTYAATVEYDVGVIPSEIVELLPDKLSASVGEYVRVDVSCPLGITFNGVYIIDADGNKTYIDGGFVMSEGGVRLGVDAYKTEYTVTFVSDGRVLLTYVCHYGEVPIPPPDPKKASNAKFSYSFIGWSKPLLAVTEDVEFSAIYSATRLPDKEQSGPAITKGVLKIIIVSAVAAVLVLFALTAIVIFVISRVRRRRKLAKAGELKTKDKNLK